VRQTAHVPVSIVPDDAPEAFARAVADVRAARTRPEVVLEEVPGPRKLAPWSLAVTAEVLTEEEEVANGRFVLLHDPDGQEGWGGAWRAVVLARSRLEPELATDPLLGSIGWTWLVECLGARGVVAANLGGTVTRVLSQSFGQLSERPAEVEVEVRGSWSPQPHEVSASVLAWTDLLCIAGGLPPQPVGVPTAPPSAP
jgi:hypothetical protein